MIAECTADLHETLFHGDGRGCRPADMHVIRAVSIGSQAVGSHQGSGRYLQALFLSRTRLYTARRYRPLSVVPNIHHTR